MPSTPLSCYTANHSVLKFIFLLFSQEGLFFLKKCIKYFLCMYNVLQDCCSFDISVNGKIHQHHVDRQVESF